MRVTSKTNGDVETWVSVNVPSMVPETTSVVRASGLNVWLSSANWTRNEPSVGMAVSSSSPIVMSLRRKTRSSGLDRASCWKLPSVSEPTVSPLVSSIVCRNLDVVSMSTEMAPVTSGLVTASRRIWAIGPAARSVPEPSREMTIRGAALASTVKAPSTSDDVAVMPGSKVKTPAGNVSTRRPSAGQRVVVEKAKSMPFACEAMTSLSIVIVTPESEPVTSSVTGIVVLESIRASTDVNV